jgi:peptide/nickel transport system permease protein
MIGYVVRRLAWMIVVLFAVSVITFTIFQVIPDGDPAVRLAGRFADPQELAAVRREWALNRPLYLQYLILMGKILTGSVVSYTQQINVLAQIGRGLPATISLAVGASTLAFVAGIIFGTISALAAGRGLDRLVTVLALFGVSTPVFLLAAVLLYYVSYKLQLLPLGGYVKLTANPLQWAAHLVLPWIALSASFMAIYSRVVRATILGLLHDDFVRTCRAKGLSRSAILVRHVLRNSLVPITSLVGLDFAIVVGGGAILTETIFNLQGVGQYAAESIGQLDIPSVLVITMLGAFAVVLCNALVDIVYLALDPRLRLDT